MELIKKYIDKITEYVCIIIMGIMTILVPYQVVVRYFFNSPNAITEVLVKYLFIWLVMYGAAYVFGLREHMNIGFVLNKLSPKIKICVEMLNEVIIAGFAIFIMCYGGYYNTTKQMIQLDSALQIPMGVIYSAIPISGAIIIFNVIYNEIQLSKQFKKLTNK